MKRRIVLGTGWKMNKTAKEAEAYTEALLPLLANIEGLARVQLFIVPPFTAITTVKRKSGDMFLVGAQNMHWADHGAYTGEISAPMLREAGADMVELGHTERRLYFNETYDAVALKVATALTHGLRPLVCVGEDAAGKAKAEDTVARQLRIAFGRLPREATDRLMVAYEPAWAIGETGVTASPREAARVHRHIRTVLGDMFGEAAGLIPVLYGGSVTAERAPGLLCDGEADGLFVGRAAWTAAGFAEIIRYSLAARS
jgi:triosephosphate isomerase